MSLYLESSALLKRYVQEADSDVAEQHLLSDKVWITARHTWVEVRRNLARLLDGNDLAEAQRYFASDFRRTHVVELDEATCDLARRSPRSRCCERWMPCISLRSAALAMTYRCCRSTFGRRLPHEHCRLPCSGREDGRALRTPDVVQTRAL